VLFGYSRFIFDIQNAGVVTLYTIILDNNGLLIEDKTRIQKVLNYIVWSEKSLELHCMVRKKVNKKIKFRDY
jgi:hypothetical protein